MKATMRAILSLAMLFAATSACADWVRVSESSDTVYYVDAATIGSQDSLRRVTVLQDYAKLEPGAVRSRRVSYEIDCGGERLRSTAGTEYSEPMAQGVTVNSWERGSEWLYVAPRTGSSVARRTPYGPILRFVCSR